MTRVQIPAYTDHWMKGDRFGEIVKISKRFIGESHISNRVRASLLTGRHDGPVEVATVKLDKSGKTVRVILADCTVYDDDREQRMVAAYVAEGLGE